MTPDYDIALSVNQLSLWYGERQALNNIDLQIPKNRITALIGPSGCGKSTLLRCFNRMNDVIDRCRIEGEILLGDYAVMQANQDLPALRRRIGMVFQRPNPFPKSIYENVVYGLRLQGVRDRRVLNEACERALRAAALWGEVKDQLGQNALTLSNGQQQRLVIARAIAIEPEVLLLDEPTSALDPISTLVIEELMTTLKQHFTLVLVTHNMQQAARVSDYTAFMHNGQLVEFDETDRIFTSPKARRTEDYITGRFG
ncbi:MULTISPECIES: phosphate ABC transporter ATP-binding protein PstB [Pantoea]|jgi:phosphate transport system ATP-binding protein|uniref:Phosphate ABC transporter ATP-binding protein n=1 Tax=Pantoea endophytica TaxID=92488 RepID=A0ABX4SMX2_9GAMM|nr:MULTISPECIES: phosphate ABC transporter ATP-binding protein PstB [Pantoea]MBD9642130.1 phosphate ABC transporter ATP-binding protein [Pantoea sp. PNT02]MBD9657959.1 phosphate ABC transporter ATP-binding protein [Pantoea sp. PNT03]MBY4888921.1 phosphate ABC transporter ATP-binding protein PstB [Pantoea sp. DY-15]MBY4951959.1 phosphate ABC transporter ATP-binding protein PstB [Pantoea sp. DY-17]MDR6349497.1 phosphate transport system ATP-binding protein [Pantoea sp. SORGH_AS_0659]